MATYGNGIMDPAREQQFSGAVRIIGQLLMWLFLSTGIKLLPQNGPKDWNAGLMADWVAVVSALRSMGTEEDYPAVGSKGEGVFKCLVECGLPPHPGMHFL